MPIRSVPARPLPCASIRTAWVRSGIATLAGAVLLIAMSFSPAGPETHPVRGRICLDEQPLPQASWLFIP